jgi:predicted kinase
MQKPSLIVVTGRPGAGKTTLAHALANAIHCPAFCRDEFKEGYVNTSNRNHEQLGPEANAEVFEAFFQAINLMLSRGISLVAEAAFQHKLWAEQLETISQTTKVAIVICSVDATMARERFIARGLADSSRERFHGDRAVHAAKKGSHLPLGSYDPPSLSVPTLTVDTSNGYNPPIEEIASFAMKVFVDESTAHQGDDVVDE